MLNPEKFRSIYADFLESGLTIRAFCANHSMNEAKFFYWQNKLNGMLPPKRGFVPVVFGDGHNARPSLIPAPSQDRKKPVLPPAAIAQSLSCEINYPNGVNIKLNGFLDSVELERLLILMRG
jgi:hypothetical protein